MTTLTRSTPAFSTRQRILLAAPLALIASMLAAYLGSDARLGYPLGYLAAFSLYWFGWCIFFPIMLLGGWRALIDLFRPFPAFTRLDWKTHLLLWWPIIFPLFFAFLPRLHLVNVPILIGSLLLGIIIGITEEIFWRGLFIRFFPNRTWLNVIYPSLLFGLWHAAPLAVRPSTMPGGAYSFVFYAVILGVSYALAARRTQSIAWCTLAHIIHDVLGLGALAYAAWLGA
jgi:uncharacterized protein